MAAFFEQENEFLVSLKSGISLLRKNVLRSFQNISKRSRLRIIM